MGVKKDSLFLFDIFQSDYYYCNINKQLKLNNYDEFTRRRIGTV